MIRKDFFALHKKSAICPFLGKLAYNCALVEMLHGQISGSVGTKKVFAQLMWRTVCTSCKLLWQAADLYMFLIDAQFLGNA